MVLSTVNYAVSIGPTLVPGGSRVPAVSGGGGADPAAECATFPPAVLVAFCWPGWADAAAGPCAGPCCCWLETGAWLLLAAPLFPGWFLFRLLLLPLVGGLFAWLRGCCLACVVLEPRVVQGEAYPERREEEGSGDARRQQMQMDTSKRTQVSNSINLLDKPVIDN
ncbi:hypothetical protein NDU88_002446 [Pleurodeles waltl]|uniref:Uncharacterized protein n=1 Tax=Pleurodeles waltl TaxID=8319 RepID=A0AAV7WLG8_PLEWA|nr:hypothetical protein NDU88_002446 [Pleurodeles waltl]